MTGIVLLPWLQKSLSTWWALTLYSEVKKKMFKIAQTFPLTNSVEVTVYFSGAKYTPSERQPVLTLSVGFSRCHFLFSPKISSEFFFFYFQVSASLFEFIKYQQVFFKNQPHHCISYFEQGKIWSKMKVFWIFLKDKKCVSNLKPVHFCKISSPNVS